MVLLVVDGHPVGMHGIPARTALAIGLKVLEADLSNLPALFSPEALRNIDQERRKGLPLPALNLFAVASPLAVCHPNASSNLGNRPLEFCHSHATIPGPCASQWIQGTS